MPRRETPCVVGFATTLEVRRKSENPGTSRKRSSMFTPGVCARSCADTSDTLAGVWVTTFSTTVMEERTGSGVVGGVWAKSIGTHKQAARTEDDLVCGIIVKRRCLPAGKRLGKGQKF